MNLTTNPLRPAITSPTIFSSQNTDFSQDCSCMSKNLTKWRISAHEGSRKPHELGGERSERAKTGNGRKKWENGGCRVDAGWMLHLPQDGFQAVIRSSFYVATKGKLIKADTSNVLPQVLVHSLVV